MTVKKLIGVISAFLLLTVFFSSISISASADEQTRIVLGAGETFKLPAEVKYKVRSNPEYDNDYEYDYDYSNNYSDAYLQSVPDCNISNPAVISVSEDTVTALSVGESTLSYTDSENIQHLYSFTVYPAPDSIALSCYSKTLNTDEYMYLKYTIPEGSAGKVTLKSSNPQTASVDDDGKIFAKKKGSVTITAEAFNGVKAECKVDVKQKLVCVDLSKRQVVVRKNAKVKLKASVNDGAVNKSYKWSSSNKKVATVRGKGAVAVVTAKKKGKATITVKVPNGRAETCRIIAYSSSKKDSISKQINSQPLIKQKTGRVALDKLVNKIFKKIFKKGYSTYDKVRAIYDYEIKHFNYGHSGLSSARSKKAYSPKDRYYSSFSDEYFVDSAYTTLVTNKGVCTDYANVFTVMTRALGLETYSVDGLTTRVDNSFTGHTWNNMVVNGRYILFDPQVEDNISNGGAINYYRFAKTDGEVKKHYKYYNRKKDIKNFTVYNSSESNYTPGAFEAEVTLFFDNRTVTRRASCKNISGVPGSAQIDFGLGSGSWETARYSIKVLKGSGGYTLSGDEENFNSDVPYYISTFEGKINADSFYVLSVSDEKTGCNVLIK